MGKCVRDRTDIRAVGDGPRRMGDDTSKQHAARTRSGQRQGTRTRQRSHTRRIQEGVSCMTTAEAARRQELYGLLGDLPPRSRPLDVQQITETEEERKEYILETLVLDLNGIEPVPAYFVRPKDGQGPLPVILHNHAHGGDYVLGKNELLAGRKVLQRPPYADILTKLGFAALCIDTWAFGERRGRSEGEIFREMLWSGQVMWGMMVFDSLRARLSGEPPGRRSRAHRHTRTVDGQHHGLVAGGPRYAGQGLHRYLLPHGLRGAHRAPFAGRP